MARSRIAAAVAAGMLATITPSLVHSAEPRIEAASKVNQDVSTARKYLKTPYNYGGRLTDKNPGMDCLGLMFLTLQDRYGIPWRSWSVVPSRLMDQLGKKTKALTLLPADPSKDAEAVKGLKEGDMIFLLGYARLRDVSVAKDREGADLYVWHTGIYSGKGNMIHASPFKDANGIDTYRVVEEPLMDLMRRTDFQGFISVRYQGECNAR